MHDENEIIQSVLGLAMLGVVLLSLVFPWSFRTRLSRRMLHLPLSLLFLYPAYEATMTPGMDLRIDLLFLWPALWLVGICYMVKLLILSASAESVARAKTPTTGSKPEMPREPPPPDMEKANERLAHLLPPTKNGKRA